MFDRTSGARRLAAATATLFEERSSFQKHPIHRTLPGAIAHEDRRLHAADWRRGVRGRHFALALHDYVQRDAKLSRRVVNRIGTLAELKPLAGESDDSYKRQNADIRSKSD